MKTTLQVNTTTRKRIQKFRIAKRESYDEIINRLMDFFKKHQEIIKRKKK